MSKTTIFYQITTRKKERKKERKKNKKSFIEKYNKNVIDKIVEIANYYGESYQNNVFFKQTLLAKLLLFKKVQIPTLDIHITTFCTLKCKECSHHIPYYKKENNHVMSFQEFKHYIDTILKNVDKIYNLLLLGGEPLLNKDLIKMIQYAESKKQIVSIRIISNGTIIPNQDLINTLKLATKTVFHISNYSANSALKNYHKDEIFELLKDNNVKYFNEKGTFWYKQPSINIAKSNNLSEYEIEQIYSKCMFRYFHLLSGDGCIYPCAQAKFIKDCNYKISIYDYINLNSNTDLKNDLIKFYTIDYYKICECCDMRDYGIKRLPAIQIERF